MSDPSGPKWDEPFGVVEYSRHDSLLADQLDRLYLGCPPADDLATRVWWEAIEGDRWRTEMDRLLVDLQSRAVLESWLGLLTVRLRQPEAPPPGDARSLAQMRESYHRGLARLQMRWDSESPRYAIGTPELEAEQAWQQVILDAPPPWELPSSAEHPIFGVFPPAGWPYVRPWVRHHRLLRGQTIATI